MTRIVNIRGTLHSVRPDRCVLNTKSGYSHVMWYPGITPQDIERMHERVGSSISLWVTQHDGGLMLKKSDANTGMVAPIERNYLRKR